MAAKQQTKAKKKRWITILAPPMFRGMPIGETYVGDPQDMVGRKLTVNLMDLTKDIKKQNINMKFIVSEASGPERVNTNPWSYEIQAAALKRQVRRRRDKIEDSFLCKTKDNLVVRVKPVAITRSTTSQSVRKALRTRIQDFLQSTLLNMSYADALGEIIYNKMQPKLRDYLKPVYPVRLIEVRSIGIQDGKDPASLRIVPKKIEIPERKPRVRKEPEPEPEK